MPLKPVFNPKNLTGRFCDQPWKTITIEGDGNVYSCMCAFWTNLPIGNLLKENLSDIYTNSINLKSIRQSVLDGNYGWCDENDCNLIEFLPACGPKPLEEFKITNTLPTNLTVAIDSICNLKCLTCRPSKYFEDILNPRVDTILMKLANEYKDFPETVMVMMDGSGEFLISRAYQKFLFEGYLPKCWKLCLMSNGNLLYKRREDIAKIAHQVDIVTITLDAATSATYNITRGGNFDIVLKGIQALLDLKIQVYFQFVLQQANSHELLEYKKLANSFGVGYGVQKVDYRSHMPSISSTYWETTKMEDNPLIDYQMLKEHLIELSKDPMCNLDGGTRLLLARL